jgi:NADH-quinone oxidoreductase subunit F
MKPLPTPFLLAGRKAVIEAGQLRDYYLHYPFHALQKALHLSPARIIVELKASGLRGRGGAAFPAGLKWESVMQQAEPVRYVIANGEEGEPGTFKDRILLEQNPLAVIEAMLIAAYTVKAREGFIYLNHSYRQIAQALEQLLQWLREDHRLGSNILDRQFDFDIQVRHGRQRYISGEETALFRALEGRRAEPSSRPPYPTEKGLWNKPTLINNIETLSCIPLIIEKGGAWFAALGPEGSHGPKLFCMSGDIKNPGVIEATMDASLNDLIEWAGGTLGTFKGAIVSGPSGRLFLQEYLDKPLTIQNGCGNGTIVVFNDTHCAADLARHITDFFFTEHCGQCLPGREAMKQVKSLMDNLERQATLAPLHKRYVELHTMLVNNSKCGLCSSGTSMAPALMQAFPEDFNRHLHGKCAVCEGRA